MKVKLRLLVAVILTLHLNATAQTSVFTDNFNVSAGQYYTTANGPTGTSTTWNQWRSGVDFGAGIANGRLTLGNDATGAANNSGWILAYTATTDFNAPFSPTLASNPGLVTWSFNMRQIRTDPGGFAAGTYGVAYILAGAWGTTTVAGSGYAVVLGSSSSADPISLVRYTAGLRTSTPIINSSTTGLNDFGNQYLSVRVTYNPANHQWQLFVRNDGAAFVDPNTGTLTLQGSAINSGSVNTQLLIMGALWNGATAATQTAFIDNIRVSVLLPVINTLSPGSKAANSGAFTLTVNGANFRAGSIVRWNGIARTTTFVSATQLTASIPATDITTPGSASVTVENGTGISNAKTFTIDNASAPSLDVSPDGLTNMTTIPGTPSSALTYTISGSSLTDNATITAPANFEVSYNNLPYSSSTTISRNATTAKLSGDPVTVSVRLKGTTVGIFSGNIVNSTAGAASKFVSVSGTVGPPEPTVQSTAVTFSNISSTSVKANFVSGNGTNRLVVVRAAAAVNVLPTDNTSYDALPLFGSGSQLGTDSFVVYSGTANSVVINSLSPTTVYHIAVFEFNGSGGTENYRTTTPATGSVTTLNDPLGWPIETLNTLNAINFDSTVDGVVNESFQGAGFSPTAGIGELSSNTFAITGFSSGNLAYGGTSVEDSDYDRGIAQFNVTEGGIYAFETSPNNMALGIQPATGDFAPGTVTVKFQNRTGSTLTSLNLGYNILIYNDQDASSNFNFSHSANNTSYTTVSGLDVISPAAADGNTAWVANYRAITVTGLSVPNGGYYYLRWSGATVSGTELFDEFAIDDISLIANPTTNTVAFEGVANSVVLLGNAKASAPLTINGTTTFNGGKLSLNGHSVTLNGPILNTTTAGLKGSAGSSLTIGGATNRSLSFDQTSTGNTNFVQSLQIRTTANNTVTLLNPIVIGGSLSTYVNQTLNLGSNALTGNFTTIGNNGTIRTQNTTSLPVPSGRTWGGIGTFVYDGAAAQTVVPGTYSNLTISAIAGGVASGDLTVNQILHLPNANPSATSGSLHMATYVLTMGPEAANTGIGEVTGIITRNSFSPLHVYTFGHPYISIMFQDAGTLPSSMSLKVSIGTAPSWKPGAIKREYDLIQTGAVNTKAVLKTHYLDSELNGNIESKLVDWAYIVASPPPIEQGRSNYDTNENWIELTNANIGLYFTSTFNTVLLGLDESTIVSSVWNGSVSNSWTTAANWTPLGVPADVASVLIPNAATTPNDPNLNPLVILGSLTIEEGGILNGPAGSQLTVNNGAGAWINYGTFTAAATSNVIFTSPDATISGTTTFGDITINSGSALRPLSHSVMRIAGNFINNGMFYSAAVHNTVEYTGSNQAIVIPNGPANAYYDLIVSGTGAIVPQMLKVRGNLTINQPVNFTGSTIVMAGDENSTIAGTVSPVFNNLTIEKSSSEVALTVDAEVSGTLTMLSGNLILGTKSLTLGQNAVAGSFSASNMVVADGSGQLKRKFSNLGSYLFPIGERTSMTQYSPIEVNLTAGTLSNAVVGVSVVDAIHPNNGSSLNNISRYWNLSQTGITSGVANITANYMTGDVMGSQSQISAAHLAGAFNQQTNPWMLYAPLANTTLTATGVPLTTTNSAFTGLKGAGLSVIISGFGSICQGSEVVLTANPTGGDGPFTYLWSGGLGTSATATPSTAIPGSETYTLTIKDANGITVTDSATVIVDTTTIGGILQSQAICSGTEPADMVLSGQTGNVLYWEVANNSDFTDSTIIQVMSGTLAGTSIGNITETTYIRAAVQNGSCTIENSSTAVLTVANTIWNGTSWSNGVPAANVSATFSANYTAAAHLNACSITVTNNAVVLIPSGFDVVLSGALVVGSGSFTVESNANLIQSGSVNNNIGNIIVKRISSPLYRLDYTMWSSPTADTLAVIDGQTLQEFSPLTAATRFYTYNASTDFFETTPRTNQFMAGQGYLIRARNNHSAYNPDNVVPGTSWTGVFEGKPFNGDLAVSLDTAGNGYNLVGNPYPSLISSDELIVNNPNITGTLYFWRRRNNDTTADASLSAYYATYTSAGGVGTSNPVSGFNTAPSPYIQVGQGFLVQVDSTYTGTQTLLFDNSLRAAEQGVPFFRNATVINKDRIWLNLSNGPTTYNQTLVAYLDGAVNGVDRADGKYINDGSVALTSLLNDNEYIIQGRAPFNVADVVPLNFKTPLAASYTIAIDHVDGLFIGDQNIFLKDNLTNVTHNLKASAYTFATEAGNFSDRFELLYESALAVADPTLDVNSVAVFKANGEININAGSITIATVKVFDIRGRLIAEKKNINANETSINAGSTNQVLIVQITSADNKTISKKIVN